MLKKWARKFHVALGLVVLIPLLITSLSGVFLGYHQIGSEPALLNEFLTTRGNELQPQLAKLYPGEALVSLSIPRAGGTRIKLKLQRRDGAEHLVFWETEDGPGEAVKIQEAEKTWLPATEEMAEWILRVHRGSWAGMPGKIWMSASAALIVVLWLLGLVLHRFSHARVHRKRSGKIHAKLGLLAGALLVLMAVSGGVLNFIGNFAKALDPPRFSPGAPGWVTSSDGATGDSLSTLIQKARAAFPGPGERLVQMRFSQKAISFYFYDNTRIHLDPQTGSVKQISGPTVHWLYNLYPLHSGHLFGIFGSFLWIFIGIATLTLTLTGLFWGGFLKPPRRLLSQQR